MYKPFAPEEAKIRYQATEWSTTQVLTLHGVNKLACIFILPYFLPGINFALRELPTMRLCCVSDQQETSTDYTSHFPCYSAAYDSFCVHMSITDCYCCNRYFTQPNVKYLPLISYPDIRNSTVVSKRFQVLRNGENLLAGKSEILGEMFV